MGVKPKSGLFQVKLTSIKYQAKLDIDLTLLSAASQGWGLILFDNMRDRTSVGLSVTVQSVNTFWCIVGHPDHQPNANTWWHHNPTVQKTTGDLEHSLTDSLSVFVLGRMYRSYGKYSVQTWVVFYFPNIHISSYSQIKSNVICHMRRDQQVHLTVKCLLTRP